MVQKWRIVPEFEEFQISNKGNVRHIDEEGNKTPVHQIVQTSGYRIVYLKNDDITHKAHYVHRLVAESFTIEGQKEDDSVVIHVDGDRENNNVKNLKWVTRSEASSRSRPRNKGRIRESIKRSIYKGKETIYRYHIVTYTTPAGEKMMKSCLTPDRAERYLKFLRRKYENKNEEIL